MSAVLFGLLFQIQAAVATGTADFPLPEGQFVPAKMPMHVVYPRPDAETQSHARHRWAHPEMAYEIPVGVQGGAWPFRYELIEAPPGATIGAHYGDVNYGAISWTPQTTTGVVDFRVRVTDQELNTVETSWQVSIDPAMFVFVQSDWSGNRVGTIDEPLASFDDWYKGDRDDDTYHNKIIVFREGMYNAVGDPNANDNVRLDASTKTPSLIAFPGETPIIDGSSAKIFSDNTRLHDLFIAGIRWVNARDDVNNAHFFWAIGDVSRSTWWRNHFHNLPAGLNGNDNPAAVFISSTGGPHNHKQHILYSENLHTEVNNPGPNGAYVDIYNSSYVLVERNIARDSHSYAGFWMKATVAFVSVRANEAWENVRGNSQIQIGYGDSPGVVPHDHEVCWNRIVVDGGSSTTMVYVVSTDWRDQHFNSFIYRNTFVNGTAWVRFMGDEPYEVQNNVVVSNNLSRWNTSIMDEPGPSLVGGATAAFTDSSGQLVGAFRDEHLGYMGFEVGNGMAQEVLFMSGFE